jgi:hypothetical protein
MRIATPFVATLLLLAFAGSALAQQATQSVTVSVQEINALSVSGPVSLNISSVSEAGAEPDAATHTTSSYGITTNGSNKKITGALSSAFPAGISVQVALAAPIGGSATSSGANLLGNTAQNLVTGLTRIRGTGLGISYTAQATVAAAPTAGETRTVTFTITDN